MARSIKFLAMLGVVFLVFVALGMVAVVCFFYDWSPWEIKKYTGNSQVKTEFFTAAETQNWYQLMSDATLYDLKSKVKINAYFSDCTPELVTDKTTEVNKIAADFNQTTQQLVTLLQVDAKLESRTYLCLASVSSSQAIDVTELVHNQKKELQTLDPSIRPEDVADPDSNVVGRYVTKYVDEGKKYEAVKWNPSGTHIVLSSYEENNLYEGSFNILGIYNVQTGEKKKARLVEFEPTEYTLNSLSYPLTFGDDTHVIFSYYDKRIGKPQVLSTNIQDLKTQILFEGRSPVVSNNRQKVVYAKDNRLFIHTFATQTHELLDLRQMYNNEGTISDQMSWSPDDNFILFSKTIVTKNFLRPEYAHNMYLYSFVKRDFVFVFEKPLLTTTLVALPVLPPNEEGAPFGLSKWNMDSTSKPE